MRNAADNIITTRARWELAFKRDWEKQVLSLSQHAKSRERKFKSCVSSTSGRDNTAFVSQEKVSPTQDNKYISSYRRLDS